MSRMYKVAAFMPYWIGIGNLIGSQACSLGTHCWWWRSEFHEQSVFHSSFNRYGSRNRRECTARISCLTGSVTIFKQNPWTYFYILPGKCLRLKQVLIRRDNHSGLEPDSHPPAYTESEVLSAGCFVQPTKIPKNLFMLHHHYEPDHPSSLNFS